MYDEPAHEKPREDGGGGGGLWVSLEILVWTLIEKQLDPSGPMASRGRSVQPSVKYVDDQKNTRQDLPPSPLPWWNFLDDCALEYGRSSVNSKPDNYNQHLFENRK